MKTRRHQQIFPFASFSNRMHNHSINITPRTRKVLTTSCQHSASPFHLAAISPPSSKFHTLTDNPNDPVLGSARNEPEGTTEEPRITKTYILQVTKTGGGRRGTLVHSSIYKG